MLSQPPSLKMPRVNLSVQGHWFRAYGKLSFSSHTAGDNKTVRKRPAVAKNPEQRFILGFGE